MTRLFQIAAAIAIFVALGDLSTSSIDHTLCEFRHTVNNSDWGSSC